MSAQAMQTRSNRRKPLRGVRSTFKKRPSHVDFYSVDIKLCYSLIMSSTQTNGFYNPLAKVYSANRYEVVGVRHGDGTWFDHNYKGNDLAEAVRYCIFSRKGNHYSTVYIFDNSTGKQVTRGEVRAA